MLTTPDPEVFNSRKAVAAYGLVALATAFTFVGPSIVLALTFAFGIWEDFSKWLITKGTSNGAFFTYLFGVTAFGFVYALDQNPVARHMAVAYWFLALYWES